MARCLKIQLSFLLLILLFAGCGGGGPDEDDNQAGTGLRMGLLQFRVQHNLQDDACLPDQCYLTMEEEDNTAAWLDHLAAHSNMAVLHWDRAIPWLAFDENPPQGVSRIDFFDGRIDDRLRNWINAFAVHFSRMPQGYLAVGLLNGQRNGLQPYRVDETRTAAVAGDCPVLAPGTQIQFTYDPGSGTVAASFDLERSYTNFVLYLYEKLHPDYLALMVETNLFKEMADPCPARWDGLVQLYRNIYDSVRPQVDPETKVFATLTLKELLDYSAGPFQLDQTDRLCRAGGPVQSHHTFHERVPGPVSGGPDKPGLLADALYRYGQGTEFRILRAILL